MAGWAVSDKDAFHKNAARSSRFRLTIACSSSSHDTSPISGYMTGEKRPSSYFDPAHDRDPTEPPPRSAPRNERTA